MMYLYVCFQVQGLQSSKWKATCPKLVEHVLRLKGMNNLKLYIVYYSEDIIDKGRLNLRKFSDESHLGYMKGQMVVLGHSMAI